MTLKVRSLRCSRRLFIIFVSLTMTLFSEKVLISNRCISGLMSNLIKKSWTDSTAQLHGHYGMKTVCHRKFLAWWRFGTKTLRRWDTSAQEYFDTWTFRHSHFGTCAEICHCTSPFCWNVHFAKISICRNVSVTMCPCAKTASCQNIQVPKCPCADDSFWGKVHKANTVFP